MYFVCESTSWSTSWSTSYKWEIGNNTEPNSPKTLQCERQLFFCISNFLSFYGHLFLKCCRVQAEVQVRKRKLHWTEFIKNTAMLESIFLHRIFLISLWIFECCRAQAGAQVGKLIERSSSKTFCVI